MHPQLSLHPPIFLPSTAAQTDTNKWQIALEVVQDNLLSHRRESVPLSGTSELSMNEMVTVMCSGDNSVVLCSHSHNTFYIFDIQSFIAQCCVSCPSISSKGKQSHYRFTLLFLCSDLASYDPFFSFSLPFSLTLSRPTIEFNL